MFTSSNVCRPRCAAGRLDIFHSYCIKCHYGSEYNTWAGTDRMFRARFENVSACMIFCTAAVAALQSILPWHAIVMKMA